MGNPQKYFLILLIPSAMKTSTGHHFHLPSSRVLLPILCSDLAQHLSLLTVSGVLSRGKTTATHGTSFHSCLEDGQVNKAFNDTESLYSLTLPDQLESMKQSNGVAHLPLQPPPATLSAKPEAPKSLQNYAPITFIQSNDFFTNDL